MKSDQDVFQSHLRLVTDDMRNSIALYTVSLAALTLMGNVCNYYLTYISLYASSSVEFTLSQVAVVSLPLVVFVASYFISAVFRIKDRWVAPSAGSAVGSLIGTEVGWIYFGHYFFPLDGVWTAIFNETWTAYVAAAIGGCFAERYLRISKGAK